MNDSVFMETLFQESEVHSFTESSTSELEEKGIISLSSTPSGESNLSDFLRSLGKQSKYEHVPLDVKIKSGEYNKITS